MQADEHGGRVDAVVALAKSEATRFKAASALFDYFGDGLHAEEQMAHLELLTLVKVSDNAFDGFAVSHRKRLQTVSLRCLLLHLLVDLVADHVD